MMIICVYDRHDIRWWLYVYMTDMILDDDYMCIIFFWPTIKSFELKPRVFFVFFVVYSSIISALPLPNSNCRLCVPDVYLRRFYCEVVCAVPPLVPQFVSRDRDLNPRPGGLRIQRSPSGRLFWKISWIVVTTKIKWCLYDDYMCIWQTWY